MTVIKIIDPITTSNSDMEIEKTKEELKELVQKSNVTEQISGRLR